MAHTSRKLLVMLASSVHELRELGLVPTPPEDTLRLNVEWFQSPAAQAHAA